MNEMENMPQEEMEIDTPGTEAEAAAEEKADKKKK